MPPPPPLLTTALSYLLGNPMKCLLDSSSSSPPVTFLPSFSSYISSVGCNATTDPEVNSRIEENIMLQSENEGEGEELVYVVYQAFVDALTGVDRDLAGDDDDERVDGQGWVKAVGIVMSAVNCVVDRISFKVEGLELEDIAGKMLGREDDSVLRQAIGVGRLPCDDCDVVHFTVVGCGSCNSVVMEGVLIPISGENVARWEGGKIRRGKWAVMDVASALHFMSSGYNQALEYVKNLNCNFLALEGGRLTNRSRVEREFLGVCGRLGVNVLDDLTRREAEKLCELFGVKGGMGSNPGIGGGEGEVKVVAFEGRSEEHGERFVGRQEEAFGGCKFLHFSGRGLGMGASVTCGRTGGIAGWQRDRATRAARSIKRVREGGKVMRRGDMEEHIVRELERVGAGGAEVLGIDRARRAVQMIGSMQSSAGEEWVNAEATRRAWERGIGMLC